MTTVIEAIEDERLFGRWLGPRDSWAAWLAVLKGTFALPMSRGERKVFRKLTGRKAPRRQARELWVAAGRRSGKSTTCAMLAVFYATLKDYTGILRPGEVATIFVIAADRAQARTVFRYIRSLLEAPLFADLVTGETKETISLSTGVNIEVGTCSHRSLRGYSCPLVIADEVAHWKLEDSSSPDTEVLNSLRPSQATFPDPLLVAISTPYARRGALWTAYERHHGRAASDVLVVKAASVDLNPTIDRRVIEAALEADPAAAGAEWLGEFRADVESFVSREAVADCVVKGRRELPFVVDPQTSIRVMDRGYVAFVDPAGGSGGDSMVMAVAHRDRESKRAILDCIREVKPKFSPAAVVAEFANTLKAYKISVISGDRYASEWPRERFRENGINYRISDRVKSEIYLAFLPLLNSGKVELLDNPRLISQLCSLERRTARGGKDSIDHPPRAHDDVANTVAGALLRAAAPPARMPWISRLGGDETTVPVKGHWLSTSGQYFRGLGT